MDSNPCFMEFTVLMQKDFKKLYIIADNSTGSGARQPGLMFWLYQVVV